jgi:hypothetical protein
VELERPMAVASLLAPLRLWEIEIVVELVPHVLVGQERQSYSAPVRHILAVCSYFVWGVHCRRLHKNEHVVDRLLHIANKRRGEGQSPCAKHLLYIHQKISELNSIVLVSNTIPYVANKL